ncbi:MAG TPA: efflux RND transporter permease subunit [Thermoanaerobaculia bacterium]|jgi:HAE1 family hydrophobic/amphiphilic exporter-1|nr:efflux RND transporter permease subunit [Thermoanaerobaculia bacterium]
MWISNFAIERPVVTVVLMLALVVFGVFAIFQLETDEFPEIDAPVVAVAVLYPGASPEVVEQEVVKPLEDAIASISGVDRITSSSLDGFGQIIIEFTFDKDTDQATQDVRDAFSRIRGELPLEMEEPILTRFDPADLPIVSLTLSSPSMTVPQLTAIADDLVEPQLRGLAGVADVLIRGGLERQVVIEVNPVAMQAAGISIDRVVQAVQAQNIAAPVGRIEKDFLEQSIRLRGRIERPEEFAEIVVSSQSGRLLRISDIATVRDATEEQRTLALYNGQEAVGIDIKKAQGNSTTAVAKKVLQRIELLNQRLPANVKLNVIQNSGDRVQESVNSVTESLVEGLLLTIIVVFVFLNSWRSTVITGVALPVSLLSAFIVVWIFGFTLNTMSLLGLALAVGILIDDAIVVRENIVRHVEMGKDHVTAAKEGTAEIGLAVAATTFSIVVVFVPIGLISGVAGQWFRPFALTIACAVLVSLLVSFSLDPMLSAYWPEPHGGKKRWLTRKLDQFNAWFDRQAVRYQGVIGWTLDHPWVTIGIAFLTMIAALAMPAMGLVGSAFFPVQDISEFNLIIDTPPGSSLAYTRLKSEEAAAMARSLNGVAYTYTTIGGESGAVDEANVYVRLKPRDQRDVHQTEIERDVRQVVQKIGGARVAIGGSNMGGGAQIQMQLKGPDYDRLMLLSERVAAEMRQVPGAADVAISTKGRRPEVEVEIDRALAGSLGVNMFQVASVLRPAFAGVDAGDWLTPEGDAYDVYVRLNPESRRTIADLRSLPIGTGMTSTPPVASSSPQMIPLGQVATIKQGVGPGEIQRLDRDRVVTVGANAEGRALSEVIADIQKRLVNVQMPAGYTIGQGGEGEEQQEVFSDMLAAMGMAVLLMYFVLVLQFESFLDPFAIMLSLPLSLIGVMIALAITGGTLNIMSLIGVLLLMGIVAKNAILLIDFAKWRHEDGMPLRESLIEAGRIRLRPILMTTFALVAGMIPVAMGIGEGAEFRAPMGRAVIGGVITSTILTLLVIPTIYELVDRMRDRTRRMFKRKPHDAEPAT